MASSDTVMMQPPKKTRIVENLLSIIIAMVVVSGMLWNWDGFWQTEIPLLTSAQETYFPVKHAQEQDKILNTRTNTVRWAEALRKIEALETVNEELRAALLKCEGWRSSRP
ncbi:MAG TPA: hypothetical protein VK997_14825 [Deferrisomatales bacterium]|nr:hypothetical protein [Deferrisomatales bacterium]